MTLSPFEVERQEFGRGALGYRRKEVDSFLDEVRTTLVGLWQERADLREENERLTERVARFTALEEQLKNTLLLAQDSAEKATEQARRESELLMREAGQKAREIVHQSHEERQRLEVALRELQSAEQETRSRFRALAQTVLTHLDDSEASATESVAMLTSVVHGGEEGRQRQAGARADERQQQRRAQQGGPVRPATPQRRAEGTAIDAPPTFDASAVARRTKQERPATPLTSPEGRTSPRAATEPAREETVTPG